LDEARTAYRDTTNRRKFEEFARGVESETFKKFYGLASNHRVLQEQFFTVGTALLREGRASGEKQSQTLRETINKWNDAIQKYNVNINNMNDLTQQIVKEGRYPLQITGH